MNEQLQNAVVTILERAISGIDSSVEFMQAELPDVIEQLLMWYGVRSAIECVVGMVSLVLVPVLWRKWIVRCKADDGHHDELDMFMIPSVVAIPPVFFGFVYVNLEWLQIWIAPKIWLMEYAANLVK